MLLTAHHDLARNSGTRTRYLVLALYTVTGLACGLPADSQLDCADGAVEQRVHFEAPSVPFGGQCAAQEQSRTCVDGRWSDWSGGFTHPACTVSEPRPCQDPVAEHGTSEQRTRYAMTQVPFGEMCQAEEQTRTCWDGAWSAWSGSSEAEACTVAEPLACTDPVAEHGAGEQRTHYEMAEVPFDSACEQEAQTRTCWNGTWQEWSGTFAYESCTVADPLPCQDPYGPHGTTETRTRYASALVPYGDTCQSEEQAHMCWNSTWSPWSGTYLYETCVVPALVGIRIIPVNPVIERGRQLAFRAMGALDTGGEQDITSLVTWTSADTTIVEFLSTSGVAVGHALGATAVRAAADGLQAEVDVEVRSWSLQTVAPYDDGAIDFAGNSRSRVIAGWADYNATTTRDAVTVRVWNDGWLPPSVVAEEDDEIVHMRVAVNERGDQHVLWTVPNWATSSPLRYYLRGANLHFLASTWSAVATLTSVAILVRPHLALSHVGHALATWREIYAQHYSPFSVQDGWPTSGTYLAGRRAIGAAIDPFGDGILLGSDSWLSPRADSAVYTYHYDRTTDSVGPRTTVYQTANTSSSPYEEVGEARLGMDALGNAIIVWVRDLFNHNAIMASHYIVGSGWQPPQEILDVGDTQIILNNLSVHPSGTAVVAFSSPYGGNGHRAFAAVYSPASGWDIPTPMSRPGLNVLLLEQGAETVAAGANGHALAVWSEPWATGIYTLVVSRYDPDLGWSPPRNLDYGSMINSESAFGLTSGFLVGYVVETSTGAFIRSATFR